MRLVVIGRGVEVGGFALGGVETAVCDKAEEAAPLLAKLGRSDARVGLLIVSPWVDRVAHRAVREIRDRKGPPLVLVLP